MEAINLGSRYRTPILPIWVTVIQDSWGVLFNPNKDLMKSYAAENRWMEIQISPIASDGHFCLKVSVVLLQQHPDQGDPGDQAGD